MHSITDHAQGVMDELAEEKGYREAFQRELAELRQDVAEACQASGVMLTALQPEAMTIVSSVCGRHGALCERADKAEEALWRIEQWSQAYPLEVFPEPDLSLARRGLEAVGITMDAVSASNMRHVVEGVGKIARDALKVKP
jgi:hypothetical protein